MLIIGIDPDLTASGVAVILNGRILKLDRIPFTGMLNWLSYQSALNSVLIKIEDPNLIKPTFPRMLPTARNKQAVSNRISQNVGQVKAVATLLIETITAAGYQVKPCRPLVGGHKTRCKKDAAYFNKLTGWTGRSNEDCRDAALIALFGG
ncbi:hypothetical protein [Rheinheimera sp. MMS21-TC3]|uniref:hypothetical protein n=1 Tax=Rheinheimera sp. MMS21-TC3 TaxID=3072790 RepID=UPI0028C49235|nr:hypothetical protein [Rheinheimera sp. MMS21-TC3]WNO60871.1 hypothetical protein RDV63_07880 [Rheinheimera sp. MMS21-TC3]